MDLRDRGEDLGHKGPWRFEKSTPVGKEDLGLNAAKKGQKQEKGHRIFRLRNHW